MEDAGILYKNFGCDPAIYRYSDWNPFATEEMTETSLRDFIESYDETDFYAWMIGHEDRVIGTVGAYDYDPEKDEIEVEVNIEKASWNRGYATEALKAVLRYLTEREGIGTVLYWAAAENKASLRVAEKAGMVHTRTETGGLRTAERTYDKEYFAYRRPDPAAAGGNAAGPR